MATEQQVRPEEEVLDLAVGLEASREIGAKHAEFVRLMSASGVLVRDRSNDPGCDGCVRITIGTREQMHEAAGVLSRTLQTLRGSKDQQ